ncbi:hypothetical protein CCHL11_01878 [Colletotrichum chlorophyti]|uniref:ABM domain-containing protein n=1 Tax=Colletotrichum chlorophyti TaxID=708187 RepID=A0A1Q8RW62_9PEZI|nr:hypothetical protein CCHL11_01878 [Colletotrichum chlorophyti]
MSSTKVTEFIILTLKSSPSSPSEPPAAWSDVTSTLKSVPGVEALHAGTQLEDPSKTVLVITWSSSEAFTSFAASEAYTPWFASLKAVSASSSSPGVPPPVFYKVPFTSDSDPTSVLSAPTTEVFVAYGVDDSFVDRTAQFARGLTQGAAPVAGFHGHAYGKISTPLAMGVDGEKGPAVTLLLGWDSMQAHLDAKAQPGPISDNIHLLRTGRKDISMYHVNLKQL